MALWEVPGIELKCLVQPQDDCLRLYELSDWDISILGYDADVVVIGGNGLENFENTLYTFGNSQPAIIVSGYSLDLYQNSDTINTNDNTSHLYGQNPHAYMSVTCAKDMIKTINASFIELYPDKEEALDNSFKKASEQLAILENHIEEVRKYTVGKNVILMNETLVYTASDFGLNVEYQYDRESGTTLYGDSLDYAINEFKKTNANVILIEKQAPAELCDALTAEGFNVVKVDIMSSYRTTDDCDYISVQTTNADAILKAYN